MEMLIAKRFFCIGNKGTLDEATKQIASTVKKERITTIVYVYQLQLVSSLLPRIPSCFPSSVLHTPFR